MDIFLITFYRLLFDMTYGLDREKISLPELFSFKFEDNMVTSNINLFCINVSNRDFKMDTLQSVNSIHH
jgi:hypothetical protein